MHRATILLLFLSIPAAAQVTSPQAPADVLRQLLTDPATTDATLSALAATGDKELLPLFAAAAEKGDRARRVFAVSAIARLGIADPSTALGTGAAEVLYNRVRNDPAIQVRTEALAQLITLQAISDERLREVIQAGDQTLQCLAARALARHTKEAPAIETLGNLTHSSDPAVANVARMTLLGLGDSTQLAPLSKAMTDPATSPRLISLLLQQIIEEKVASAEKLAAQIAASTESISLKVRAYHAAAAVSADGPALLAEAIEKNDHTVLQTQLLKILAELGEARGPLETLSRRDDAVGLLARFELARPTGGDDAAEAAGQAVEAGHAVVLDYLLDRARRDIAQRRDASAFYTQALIAILHSVQADSPVMLPEHTQAAQAAELLGELATPQAVQTITTILTGHYNALSRTVAGGLLRCKNKTACEWLAPLLTSPYEELSSDAALTLGQHGDHRAAPALQDIVNHSHHHRPELTALAGWYLAKLSGQAAPTVSALCEAFK